MILFRVLVILSLSINLLASEFVPIGVDGEQAQTNKCLRFFSKGFAKVVIPDSIVKKMNNQVTPKFIDGFSFIKNSAYVLIKHEGYPDKEFTTVVDLNSLEVMGGFIWVGKDGRLFRVRDTTMNVKDGFVMAISEQDKVDSVVIWDVKNNRLKEQIEVASIEETDYVYSRSSPNHSSNSREGLSAEHPYYLRVENQIIAPYEAKYSEASSKAIVQLINWQTKKLLNMPEVNTLSGQLMHGLFSSEYQFLATRTADHKSIIIESFESLESKLNQEEVPGVKELEILPVKTAESVPTISRKSKFLGLFGVSRAEVSAEENIKQGEVLEEGATPIGEPINKKPKFNYNSSIKTENYIQGFEIAKWAPIVVTRSNTKMQIWDARSGELVSELTGDIKGFRVLNNIPVIAYLDGSTLILYSVTSKQQVGRVPDFKPHMLADSLRESDAGDLYISNAEGKIYQLFQFKTKKDSEGKSKYEYEFVDHNFQIQIDLNNSKRSFVITDKGQYVVQVDISFMDADGQMLSKSTMLTVDTYSLGSRTRVDSFAIEMTAAPSTYTISPDGRNIVFTSSERDTGVIKIKEFIMDRGL